ncbi:hypothetical protein XENTR_v10019209 [Xenopus tropicalis]|uniref:Toll-like receptor 13 n=1 Tax=Xenopus tropicalis TaxID=8364 RepID=A0A6I8PPJ7_XENTR|nr:toll-like receptor 13 [Xenopus tropicalis]KAE8593594.1 hypothetical protein XENTR_v10019209 [Xenopus tropicalis]
MAILLVALTFVVLLIPGLTSYGFRNCIQSSVIINSYNCIARGLTDVKSAVGDLPSDVWYLNISYNNIQTLHQGSFGHMPFLRTLRLNHNQLQRLDPGAFENLTMLEKLHLSSNKISNLSKEVFCGLQNVSWLFLDDNLLSSIHPEAFSHLTNLQNLNLSMNNLHNFEKVVQSIHPLQKLNTLMLCSNQISSLNHTHRLPSTLRWLFLCKNQLATLDCQQDFFLNISWLDLSYNNIATSSLQTMDLRKVIYLNVAFNGNFDILIFIKNPTVPINRIDYSGLNLNNDSKLKTMCRYLKGFNINTLYLSGNKIKTLNRGTLTDCPLNKTLDLSRNRLKGLGCLEFMSKTNVENLIVEHNLLKELINCSKKSHFPRLRHISFRYNRIWIVKGNAFHFAPNLQTLYLNINNIVFLERYSFSGLGKLRELRLDNNLITDLYENSFANLTELRILNLRNNRVSVIFSKVFYNLGKLTTLDLGGNKITQLKNQSFYGLRSLSKLYLDGNQIKEISRYVFSHVESTLLVLDLKSNHLRYNTTRETYSPFLTLSKLYDLKLQAQQPYGLTAIPQGFFKGLKSLKALYLAQNRISSLSSDAFNELGQLTYLSLAEDCNGIQRLPPGIFKNLKNLQILDLENICLQYMRMEVFSSLTNLKRLLLTKNALTHINIKVFENMTQLKYLDLRKCPLSCTCNNAELQMWFKKGPVQIVLPYNLTCPANENSYFHDFDTHVCDMEIKIKLFCSSFTSILLFIIIPIVYSKFYWMIKYNYFLFVAWLHERWKSEKELYKYDAFVSYNTHDEEWVYKIMLPVLETSALRLCLHHRDFQLGRDIIDNIVDSIHNSRKTICVVSRSYLQSEWCSLEMQLASYKLFDEMRDVLVLILLDNIPDRELSTYHRMRKLMLKKTYITWPTEPEAQQLFWAKVQEAVSGKRPSEGHQGIKIVKW